MITDAAMRLPQTKENADIKKYRGCTQSAPAVYMITDAAMRLPQAKENADNRRRF